MRDYPALARAAALVAGPQLRNMGTLGGNLCLDTRCTYYNQTWFWRRGARVLPEEGRSALPRGAAGQALRGRPFLGYRAGADRARSRGRDRHRARAAHDPVEEFFVADGIHNNVLEPGEIVTRIRLPQRSRGLMTGYQKLRPRGAIDFPMLSIAFAARMHAGAREQARLVVGPLAARPRTVAGLEALVRGKPLDERGDRRAWPAPPTPSASR